MMDWKFILTSLDCFKFGERLINWICTLYSNSIGRIINNGYSRGDFNISMVERGGGGGNTPGLSPQIVSCVICAAVLSLKIKQCYSLQAFQSQITSLKYHRMLMRLLFYWMVRLSHYEKNVYVFVVFFFLVAILKDRPASELTMIRVRSLRSHGHQKKHFLNNVLNFHLKYFIFGKQKMREETYIMQLYHSYSKH